MRYLFCIVLLFTHSVCDAFEIAEKILEKYAKTVRVSGGLEVGVMFSSESKRLQKDENVVYVTVPKGLSWKGREKICLDITSRDGKYSGLFSWDFVGPGEYQIPFVSDFPVEIAAYETDAIVVLASVDTSCREKHKDIKHVAASWGDEYRRDKNISNKVSIFINSLSYKTYVEVRYNEKRDNEETPKAKCTPVSEKNNAGYNKQCSIATVYDRKIKDIRIIQKDPGETPEIVKFSLVL